MRKAAHFAIETFTIETMTDRNREDPLECVVEYNTDMDSLPVSPHTCINDGFWVFLSLLLSVCPWTSSVF